MNPNKTEG